MKLTINGQLVTCSGKTRTIKELLTYIGLHMNSVVVEVNHQIVPIEQQAKEQLQDGDRIEIIHFVGGG
ncbi:thiamine biosynthesis protein ThiS [Paenibacillus sp. CAA11]|uniref:sulfur carrier protein ThiS n=1 Tax=Paenibacillus sp. CAA11 TaxID=1532905 RepID=UPI000D3B5649|nr:sulfur carrier protein ThiS [Paenibacillus sp. CAA11]AWB44851.1 thiamine biosynthesis protein ThiS [Paenibacillus sp. CAA11]